MTNDYNLTQYLVNIISETNGITLEDTINLAIEGSFQEGMKQKLIEFKELLFSYDQDKIAIEEVLAHEVALCLMSFFKKFPIKYKEEHIHLTGSLTEDFIYPRLKKLLEGPNKDLYFENIQKVYPHVTEINSSECVKKLIELQDSEEFDRYLEILLLPKLILIDKESHKAAAKHMANDLYHKFNVGMIRLKFTLSRVTSSETEQIPGAEDLKEEDVLLGLYEGFKEFQDKHLDFNFVLSPCFRKEANHFDAENFETKKAHTNHQVQVILDLIETYPFLKNHLCDVDTVGNERNLYRKIHFLDMQRGLRRLQYKGFSIRSHHGETWKTLRHGVQAVDNAMNIWHIDTLEHGISLGINPNHYFHSLYLRVMRLNFNEKPLSINQRDYNEVMDMDWEGSEEIRNKLIQGIKVSAKEKTKFIKIKFHTAREIEHYQHDVLNRMIQKNVSLISLPSSNKKLTGQFHDYKDHPFSWWEKKGVTLGIGTDNYVTLKTNYLKEMMIALITDFKNLKITKLLMIATGEKKRPFISQFLWKMRD
jgi:adenosine deaminase